MSHSVHGLISEIRNLTTGRMDADKQETILEEVRTHLDAGIQARLELGMAPSEAEKESVAAFGNAKRFVTELTSTCGRLRIWQALQIAMFVALASVLLTAPRNLLDFDEWYQFWTVTSFAIAIGVAAVYGFRYARPKGKTFLLAACASFALAITALATIYIAEPGEGFETRSTVQIFATTPNIDAWQHQQQAELDTMMASKLEEINKQQPPYKIPRSVVVPTSRTVVNTREQARELLRRYNQRAQANLSAAKPIVAASTKAAEESLAIPFHINAINMTAFLLPNFVILWVATLTAYLFGSVVRILGRQRVALQFLARPILEIGLDENTLKVEAFNSRTSRTFSPLENTEWIDKWVAIALVATILLTSILVPFAGADRLVLGTLLVSGISLAILNWRVKRPQFLTLLIGFVIGVPIFSYTSWLGNRAVYPRAHLQVTDGLSISGALMFLAFLVCTASWFAGSIMRRIALSKTATE